MRTYLKIPDHKKYTNTLRVTVVICSGADTAHSRAVDHINHGGFSCSADLRRQQEVLIHYSCEQAAGLSAKGIPR